MDSFQLTAIDLGVDLRGGDGGMPEHFLNDSQIGPSGQQVRGKGVSKLMRVDGLFNARLPGIMTDKLPDACRGEGMPSNGEEDGGAGAG